MAKENAKDSAKDKEKKRLRDSFKSFDLDPVDPPAPANQEPENNIFDLGLNDRGAANDDDAQEDDDRPSKKGWSLEDEAEQERIVEAAMGILPKRKEIRKALDEAVGLDMLGVIAAGLIESHYRGRLDPKDVDSMSAAALLVDTENFDDIFESFDPLTTSIVDEIRMTDEIEDNEQYYTALSQMEPESKRVFIALQLAELEAAQEDLKEGRDGPYQDDHEDMAEKIAAASEDVDKGLVRRAVSLFNEVSRGSGYTVNLTFDKDGYVQSQPFPDIPVKKEPKDPSAKGSAPKPPKP
ncbi:MAG: hypothetical protein IT560_11645 [Alphaproteobacteria bacterium]|nr:hypothetical protein [Alphaproteobacteria bacterium]